MAALLRTDCRGARIAGGQVGDTAVLQVRDDDAWVRVVAMEVGRRV